MINNQPLYDIQGYTDNELYEILDLVNPSDRVLEAKILMEIHKYENINTKSARKLALFFDEIYNHFFETEDDVVEGFEFNPSGKDTNNDGLDEVQYTPGGYDVDKAKKKYSLQDQLDSNATDNTIRYREDVIKDGELIAGDNTNTAEYRKDIEERLSNATTSAEFFDSFGKSGTIDTTDDMKTSKYREDNKDEPSTKKVGSMEIYNQSNISPDKMKKSNVNYTQDLEYSRGKLNPIMKETTKRIISIDSQYRSDKRTFSTDFTFNLSDPLKDVVSLKLYSVQIPYTWYTIGKAYGNNFFYFKGRTPGLDSDSGLHDVQIQIAAGNYTPTELIDEVNTSINILKASSTDIDLGTTNLSYNSNTSLTTANIDLKKSYNESSYSIQFDDSTIPSYMGFLDTEYKLRNLRSIVSTYSPTEEFIVTENNNYFTVNVYQDNISTINNSFDISLNPSTYTRESLITQLRTELSVNNKLINTNCSISSDNTYIDINLQLSRIINGVKSTTKTEIQFYDEQHYTIDFSNGIFSNLGSINISGNIGDEISKEFNIGISTKLLTIPDILLNSANNLNITVAPGTYTDVSPTTSGSGTGATLTIIAILDQITSVTVTNSGVGYSVGDTLSVPGFGELSGSIDDLIFTINADHMAVETFQQQPICKIITKFRNGSTNTNYKNEEIIHDIKLDNAERVVYEENQIYNLYDSIGIIIRNYEHNNVKIFANTTISSTGTMILKINADKQIWIRPSSCFGFENKKYMLNEFVSENESTEQSGNYTITTNPFVFFTPNIPNLRDNLNGINDISFSVPKFGSKNLTQYIDVINESIIAYDLSNNNIFNTQQNTFITQENTEFDNTTAYPPGTYAYLQNNIFQMHFNINKVFDESMYILDLTGSIFLDNQFGTFMANGVPILNNEMTILQNVVYTISASTTFIPINANTIIFTLKPKKNGNIIVNGNENEDDIILTIGNISYVDGNNSLVLGASDVFKQINDIINDFIKPAIINYKDPISNVNIFSNTQLIAVDTETGFDISLETSIQKGLVAKNYDIFLKDTDGKNLTWNSNLKISNSLTNDNHIDTSFNIIENQPYVIYDSSGIKIELNENQVDNSGNILNSSGNILESDGTVIDINNNNIVVNGLIMYTVIPNGNVKLSGSGILEAQDVLQITRLNNIFRFKAIDDGVATPTNQNDVQVEIPIGYYYRDQLLAEMNTQINNASATYSNITGTSFELVKIDDKYRIKLVVNIKREYGTTDFNLVFFDNESFATCVSGASSVQNTTWDTTIGWIMGFREYTTYDMSAPGTDEDTVVDNVNGNILTIIGDTGLSTNLYNYFLICLDDYNQSHLNDGLITITNSDTTIPLPSYANRSDFVCDPVTNKKVYNVTTGLTEKQIYSAQEAMNSADQENSIGTSVPTKSYGTGPFATDVFGLIPMKVSGLTNGSSYVEFGGTLQNQERNYFGPVNINRMSVKLVTDRGNLVDLNKANWSFSLICETLNKQEK